MCPHAAFNKISKIIGLGMLEKLEQLYLNNNCIARIENTYSLTTLHSLYLSTPPPSRLKQNRKD